MHLAHNQRSIFSCSERKTQWKTEFDRKYGSAWVLKDKSGLWAHKWLMFHPRVWSTRPFHFSSSASSQWPFPRTGRRHNKQTDCGTSFSWRCWTVWCRAKRRAWMWVSLPGSLRLYVNGFLFPPVLLTAQMTYFEVSNKKKLNRLLFGSWFCLSLANLEEVLTLSVTWLSVEKKKNISCVLLFFILVFYWSTHENFFRWKGKPPACQCLHSMNRSICVKM